MKLDLRSVVIATGQTGTFKGAEKVEVENTGADVAVVAGRSLATGEIFKWECNQGDTLNVTYDTTAGTTLLITYHGRHNNTGIGAVNLVSD